MKEMSFIEKVYYNLNTAFSLNYMVLQNLARLLPSGNNIFTRDDIFGEKSSARYHYEQYYEELAEIRNEQMDGIRKFFSPEIYFEQFKKDSTYLLEDYNEKLGKNVKYSDVFSERNIKNWELFNKIFDDVDNFKGKNSLETLKLQFGFAQFLTMYDEYKDWLSAYEIFEVLEADITSRGSKSFYYGIISNPDVLKLNFDDYHEYSKNISEFLLNQNKKPKKQRIIKDNGTPTAESISLDTIINFYNRMEDRFGHANSHLMEIGSLFSKIQYHLSHMSDGDFEIDEVYVHRNEILSLVSSMLTFPELYELADKISLKLLGKNVDFSQIKQKENT